MNFFPKVYQYQDEMMFKKMHKIYYSFLSLHLGSVNVF